MLDVIVIGGGVIGLSIAWELAGQGLSVRVLDKSGLGQEASWAGAGMLPPGNLAGANLRKLDFAARRTSSGRIGRILLSN